MISVLCTLINVYYFTYIDKLSHHRRRLVGINDKIVVVNDLITDCGTPIFTKEYLIIHHQKFKVMKNYITTIVLALTAITLSAAPINPIKTTTLISNATVELTIDDALSDLFIKAKYNTIQDCLEFSVDTNISFIQIFNANGKLEFQLPVLSNKVKISKNIFPTIGNYKLGFMIDGEKNVQFSEVTIK